MRNCEGYIDPTPAGATVLMKERRAALRVMESMVRYAAGHGYEVVGDLRVKNKRSGRVYKWM